MGATCGTTCWRVLDLLGPEPSFPLAFAALLHDVGKPRTVGRTADRYTFYHHEHVGAAWPERFARLKLSNAESDRIVWLVEKHQILADAGRCEPANSRRSWSIRHPRAAGPAPSRRSGQRHSLDHVEYCEFLLREWSHEELDPPPLLTGHDLSAPRLNAGAALQTPAQRGTGGSARWDD